MNLDVVLSNHPESPEYWIYEIIKLFKAADVSMGKDYVLSVIKAAEPYLKDFGEFDWFFRLME